MQEVIEKAKNVRLLVCDVDGVLTDGRLYYGNQGEELKAFSILDGLGIKLLRDTGVDTAIITGRVSELVKRRASELGITLIVQGREDKLVALKELSEQTGIRLSEIAYIGDDLPDLSAIINAGLGITVANGHDFVVQHANWQTTRQGGSGAVREVCDLIMKAQGTLKNSLEHYLG